MNRLNKIKIFSIFAMFLTIFMLCCAFKIDENVSLKEFTNPHIATYECTYAMFGGDDLLEDFDYFKITLLNKKELEVSFKKHDEAKKSFVCPYEYVKKTHELTAEFGILGYKYRQKVTINDGKFTINFNILTKPLVMIFESK
jgi:hypothetical protein